MSAPAPAFESLLPEAVYKHLPPALQHSSVRQSQYQVTMSSGAYEKISQDNGDVTSSDDPKDCHNLASLIPKSESIIAETESMTVIAKSPSPKYTSHGTLVVPGWPSKPNTLTRSGLARYSGMFCDIVCIVATLPFFALATAAVKLNGHPASSNQWNVISEAMNTVSHLVVVL